MIARTRGHPIVIPGRRRAIEQESARMAPLSEAQQLETLLELQRDLALEASVDKVLWRITLAATFMLDADRATLYVVDQAKNELWSRALTEGGERGESVAAIREIRLPLDGRSLAAAVARTGELLRIDEPYEDPRFDPSVDARTGYRTRSILVGPIDSRDRSRLGVLQAVNHKGGPFHAEEERYAVALASSAGIALEYVQLSTELAAERLRVVKIAEGERHRLARDLHDGVAQTLANAALGIELAQRRAQQDVGGAMSDLGQLRGRLLESQKGLRDILFALRPLALEDGGLTAAVRALASYASRGSLGLLQMRESARLIGAQLSLDSSPGQGTRVRLRIPT